MVVSFSKFFRSTEPWGRRPRPLTINFFSRLFDFIWFTSHCSCHESTRNGDRGEITDIFPTDRSDSGLPMAYFSDIYYRSNNPFTGSDRAEQDPFILRPGTQKKINWSNGSDSLKSKSLIRFLICLKDLRPNREFVLCCQTHGSNLRPLSTRFSY